MSKILVVDDDVDLLKLLERGLSARGHEVAIAEDGEIGLEVAFAMRPDVVVTDLLMPRVDGYELLSGLREHATTESIPVIILSEYQGKESRLAAFRLGCDDFLPKPFELEELGLRVDHVLKAHEGAGDLSEVEGIKMRGCLGDLALPSLLALLEMDRQSGVLELDAADLHVELRLDAGRVVGAVDLSDPSRPAFDVFCSAVRIKRGRFTVRDGAPGAPEELHRATTELLLDAFQRIDEEDARNAESARAPLGRSA
jgi:DNA-binding response OmpR family regulator